MRIDLQETSGKKTVTRQDGEAINKMISDAWDKEEEIRIDFRNILIASVSFFDEAFGQLTFEHPKEELTKKLIFDNLEDYDKALLNDILISRYHQIDLGQNGPSKQRRRKRKNFRT
jgi:hypothetical protein